MQDKNGITWGQTFRSTRTFFSDSKAIIPCSYSLLLRAKLRRNKYHLHSVWFDPTGLKHTIYRTQGEHDNHYTPTICIQSIYSSFDIIFHRLCGTYWDFLDRRLLLIRKLLNEEELLCVLSGKVEVITSKVLLPQS